LFCFSFSDPEKKGKEKTSVFGGKEKTKTATKKRKRKTHQQRHNKDAMPRAKKTTTAAAAAANRASKMKTTAEPVEEKALQGQNSAESTSFLGIEIDDVMTVEQFLGRLCELHASRLEASMEEKTQHFLDSSAAVRKQLESQLRDLESDL